MDVVNRKDVLEVFENIKKDYPTFYLAIEECIKKLPATGERAIGKWIVTETIFECSECEYHFSYDGQKCFFSYCPNCGAEMIGGKKR